MVVAFCRYPLCKEELFVMEARFDDGYVVLELARARAQMKLCCADSVDLAITAIRMDLVTIHPEYELRIVEPCREPNSN